MPLMPCSQLEAQLEKIAAAARRGLDEMAAANRDIGFEYFPKGTCGPVSELIGRLVLEQTGHEGTYVCGGGHPDLPPQQSHAWLEVGSFIVDLTHDQFDGTGLRGWVFSNSAWHRGFTREEMRLCLQPSSWMQYPRRTYAAMRQAMPEILDGRNL